MSVTFKVMLQHAVLMFVTFSLPERYANEMASVIAEWVKRPDETTGLPESVRSEMDENATFPLINEGETEIYLCGDSDIHMWLDVMIGHVIERHMPEVGANVFHSFLEEIKEDLLHLYTRFICPMVEHCIESDDYDNPEYNEPHWFQRHNLENQLRDASRHLEILEEHREKIQLQIVEQESVVAEVRRQLNALTPRQSSPPVAP